MESASINPNSSNVLEVHSTYGNTEGRVVIGRSLKKKAINLVSTFFPVIHERLMLSFWRKAYGQTWGNPIHFSRPPSQLTVKNIGQKSYCANMIDSHHLGAETEITIGNYTSIGQNFKLIGSSGHSLDSLSTFPFPSSSGRKVKLISIGSDVWIGDDVTVIGEVRIGNGCIIGAGSIVTKDLNDFGIYVGAPARLVKYRYSSEVIQRLKRVAWWDRDEGTINRLEKLLTGDDVSFNLRRLEEELCR